MLKGKLEYIMTEDIVTLSENATIAQAAHILLRFRINGVLIVSKDDKNRILGVVTTTDLLKLLDEALSKQGQRVNELTKISEASVTTVAKEAVLSVQKDTKIEKVIALMHKQNKHTIPVFDKDKLVGIVGRHDVLNAAYG